MSDNDSPIKSAQCCLLSPPPYTKEDTGCEIDGQSNPVIMHENCLQFCIGVWIDKDSRITVMPCCDATKPVDCDPIPKKTQNAAIITDVQYNRKESVVCSEACNR